MIDLSGAGHETMDLATKSQATGSRNRPRTDNSRHPLPTKIALAKHFGEGIPKMFFFELRFQNIFHGHRKFMHLLLIFLYKIIGFTKGISENDQRKK